MNLGSVKMYEEADRKRREEEAKKRQAEEDRRRKQKQEQEEAELLEKTTKDVHKFRSCVKTINLAKSNGYVFLDRFNDTLVVPKDMTPRELMTDGYDMVTIRVAVNIMDQRIKKYEDQRRTLAWMRAERMKHEENRKT